MSMVVVGEYSSMRHCAARGCDVDVIEGDGYLERISPAGPGCAFVGLCQDHIGKTIIFKPEAAELINEAMKT